MPFSYYKRLSAIQKKIYQKSNEISSIHLSSTDSLYPYLQQVFHSLKNGDQKLTQENTQSLVSFLIKIFKVSRVQVRVLERRPSERWGELHGLYERRGPFQIPRITVWMRTAKREQVVAFKTFLRTVLHEVMHHLDYTLFKLGDSFHTEGFYQRESSMLRQLWDCFESIPRQSYIGGGDIRLGDIGVG